MFFHQVAGNAGLFVLERDVDHGIVRSLIRPKMIACVKYENQFLQLALVQNFLLHRLANEERCEQCAFL